MLKFLHTILSPLLQASPFAFQGQAYSHAYIIFTYTNKISTMAILLLLSSTILISLDGV